MSTSILLFGLFVFVAEVLALTIGTVRTLSLVQGAARTAFILAVL